MHDVDNYAHGRLKERRFSDGGHELPTDPYDTERYNDISDSQRFTLGAWIKARVAKDSGGGSWDAEYEGVPLSVIVDAFRAETGYASVPPGAVIEGLYRLGYGAVLGSEYGPAMRFKAKMVRS